MNIEKDRECDRLHRTLKRALELLHEAQNKLVAGDNAVELAQGKLDYEESILRRIVQQITENSQAAIGCMRRDVDDCFRLLVELRRDEAQQHTKIQRLKDELRVKNTRRDGIEREVADRQRQHDRVIADLRRNGCT